MIREILPKSTLRGEIFAPGDKSISHRAIMCNAIANGDAHITNFLMGADSLKTIDAFRNLGVDIEVNEDEVIVHGKGLHSLKEPHKIIDAGNSGTTARLMLGMLAGQRFDSIIDGDDSLRLRPMARVVDPLSSMGARILVDSGKYLPANIFGSSLHGIEYTMPVASAQVKSSIIFASLFGEGKSVIHEEVRSRNHTEIMLSHMGADIKVENGIIEIGGGRELTAHDVYVQGDISSASFFIVAGLIAKDAELVIRNVNINKTRSGILGVLGRMGGDIRLENIRQEAETMADIYVKSSRLHGTEIGGKEIPSLIDELPIIAIAGMLAEGDTVVGDAAELKVKETNRIDTICDMVTALGGKITPKADGFIVHGVEHIEGGVVNSHGDHRIAMAGAIGGIVGRETTHIVDADSVEISYPEFFDILERISQ